VTSETGQAWIARSDGQDPQPLRWKEGLAHVGSILSVSFNADASRVLLVGGVDGRATIWDVPTRRLLSELSGHLGAITTGAISPDGGQVMTASEDGSIRLWQNGWLGLLGYLRGQTTATLNPEQRIVLLGESESQALKRYHQAEQVFGRAGSWPSPFQFPF
jgi:WD40 repeat protein